MSDVRLRPLAEGDVDHILTWVNDPEITGNIAAFSGHAFTRDDELAYIRRTLASTSDVVFSIEEAATGRYLGQTGIHQIHERSKVGDQITIRYQLEAEAAELMSTPRQQPGRAAPASFPTSPPIEKKHIIIDDRAFYDARSAMPEAGLSLRAV